MLSKLLECMRSIEKRVKKQFAAPVNYFFFEIADLKVVCRARKEKLEYTDLPGIATIISNRSVELKSFEQALERVYELYKNNGIKRADDFSDHMMTVGLIIDGVMHNFPKDSSFVLVEIPSYV